MTARKKASTAKEIALLFSVPVSLFLVVLGLIHIPQWLARPSYDFVYASCDSYTCDTARYYVDETGAVAERKEAEVDKPISTYRRSIHNLYYYDTERRSSRQISLEEARDYKLDASRLAPDGYQLVYDRADSTSFLFWGASSDGGWYLTDRGVAKLKTDINTSGAYRYDRNVSFIGWVKE